MLRVAATTLTVRKTGGSVLVGLLVLGAGACTDGGTERLEEMIREGGVGGTPTLEGEVPGGGGASDSECVVGRVVDGDSLDCEDGRRLRLLLIDSPELDQDPFGREARRVMQVLAPEGTRIRLEYDIERRDDYDRELVYVGLGDGRSVNEEMLRRGFAVVIVFPPNVREVDRYRVISDSAKAGRKGLWAVDGFTCLPSAHRSGRCDE
jgi:micrococcal nuclease